MCNKQRTFIKNNNVNSISFNWSSSQLFIIIVLIFFWGCGDPVEPEKNDVILSEYPSLSDDITERNFSGLWSFVDHENNHVRRLALKAIGKSQPEELSEFVDYAIDQDDPLVWQALSLLPVQGERLNVVTESFRNESVKSEQVCNVFFNWGDSTTLNVLLQKPDLLMESEVCSKAVGGILSRTSVSDITRRQIFDLAFNSGDETIWRNLLYGFYRSPANRPRPGSVLNDNIATYLESQGHLFSIEMDRYITRISGKVGLMNVMERRSDRELNEAVQLSIELAMNLITLESEELNHPFVKRLLHHNVNNVVAQSLQSLREFGGVPSELLDMIEFEIASITRDPEVFFEALNLLAKNGRDIDGYQEKVDFMESTNPYLAGQILTLYRNTESMNDFINRLESNIENGGLMGLRSIQTLLNVLSENYESNPELMGQAGAIARSAFEDGDPSVMVGISSFLNIPEIFPEEDYGWMYQRYEDFVDSGQLESARVVGDVLESRFPDQFEPLEIPEKPFREPNWQRLYEIGIKPNWVLETEKGTITIQLDPLASPFTVSSIDSLTRTGEYDNVPFHRVVRSFVIQGGDIERADGYGGPDYKLPTEPSLKSFERGMVGMASDGTDTEGSQYFVMLNWSPHLDPNYTIFGHVTSGMDVADRIQLGDRVLKARIAVR